METVTSDSPAAPLGPCEGTSRGGGASSPEEGENSATFRIWGLESSDSCSSDSSLEAVSPCHVLASPAVQTPKPSQSRTGGGTRASPVCYSPSLQENGPICLFAKSRDGSGIQSAESKQEEEEAAEPSEEGFGFFIHRVSGASISPSPDAVVKEHKDPSLSREAEGLSLTWSQEAAESGVPTQSKPSSSSDPSASAKRASPCRLESAETVCSRSDVRNESSADLEWESVSSLARRPSLCTSTRLGGGSSLCVIAPNALSEDTEAVKADQNFSHLTSTPAVRGRLTAEEQGFTIGEQEGEADSLTSRKKSPKVERENGVVSADTLEQVNDHSSPALPPSSIQVEAFHVQREAPLEQSEIKVAHSVSVNLTLQASSSHADNTDDIENKNESGRRRLRSKKAEAKQLPPSRVTTEKLKVLRSAAERAAAFAIAAEEAARAAQSQSPLQSHKYSILPTANSNLGNSAQTTTPDSESKAGFNKSGSVQPASEAGEVSHFASLLCTSARSDLPSARCMDSRAAAVAAAKYFSSRAIQEAHTAVHKCMQSLQNCEESQKNAPSDEAFSEGAVDDALLRSEGLETSSEFSSPRRGTSTDSGEAAGGFPALSSRSFSLAPSRTTRLISSAELQRREEQRRFLFSAKQAGVASASSTDGLAGLRSIKSGERDEQDQHGGPCLPNHSLALREKALRRQRRVLRVIKNEVQNATAGLYPQSQQAKLQQSHVKPRLFERREVSESLKEHHEEVLREVREELRLLRECLLAQTQSFTQQNKHFQEVQLRLLEKKDRETQEHSRLGKEIIEEQLAQLRLQFQSLADQRQDLESRSRELRGIGDELRQSRSELRAKHDLLVKSERLVQERMRQQEAEHAAFRKRLEEQLAQIHEREAANQRVEEKLKQEAARQSSFVKEQLEAAEERVERQRKALLSPAAPAFTALALGSAPSDQEAREHVLLLEQELLELCFAWIAKHRRQMQLLRGALEAEARSFKEGSLAEDAKRRALLSRKFRAYNARLRALRLLLPSIERRLVFVRESRSPPPLQEKESHDPLSTFAEQHAPSTIEFKQNLSASSPATAPRSKLAKASSSHDSPHARLSYSYPSSGKERCVAEDESNPSAQKTLPTKCEETEEETYQKPRETYETPLAVRQADHLASLDSPLYYCGQSQSQSQLQLRQSLNPPKSAENFGTA